MLIPIPSRQICIEQTYQLQEVGIGGIGAVKGWHEVMFGAKIRRIVLRSCGHSVMQVVQVFSCMFLSAPCPVVKIDC